MMFKHTPLSRFLYSLCRQARGLIILSLFAISVNGQQKEEAGSSSGNHNVSWPDPVTNNRSPLMLTGDWLPANPHDIDFNNLPRVPAKHAVVSDVRGVNGVNQHNYLVYYNKKFWIMWSDGPGVEDRVGQRVKYATSKDGLTWSAPRFLTPEPPGSGKESPYYGTRTDKGFRYIARGFWIRNGQLLALASLDEAAGFFGKSLQLRAFSLDKGEAQWKDIGVVFDNTINNFAPKKLPTGEWMMSSRQYDYKITGAHFLIGGNKNLTEWESFPVWGSNDELSAEEPYWWVLPDNNLMALFRDNNKSGYLYRAFSIDNGRNWSKPVRTNFPDARSKFSGLRLRDGRYVLVSNPNPEKRDPLAISVSDDGLVFNKMFYLVGGRHIDYPHIIEHNGYLLIAFAGNAKQSVEVLKVKLSDLDKLKMKP
ncbi:MAG: exo-alpha-sialidase [Chitinophagaceae bacterium]|nr:exo-alpha-sialidase [Chitinophagaceae bacterium]